MKCRISRATLIPRPPAHFEDRPGSCTATDEHRSRCRKTPRRPRGIGRAFHVEDEKGGSLAAVEAEISRLRLEFLDEGRDRLLQRSRFQRVAPVGRVDVSAQHHTHEFPPFSSTSSRVPCNISVGKAADGRSGKKATSNSGGCNQKYRTPPNESSSARSATALNVGSGCCSSKRGR